MPKLLQIRRKFGNFPIMEGTRVSQAVARIETALGRIERIAASPVPAPHEDGAARRRAEALEQAVRDGLAELDQLIERLDS